MIGLLSSILEGIEDTDGYIVAGAEEVVNAFFAVIEVAVVAANALFGELPEDALPSGLRSLVGEINWFFLVTDYLGVLATFIAAYVVWLGLAWVYRKSGNVS